MNIDYLLNSYDGDNYRDAFLKKNYSFLESIKPKYTLAEFHDQKEQWNEYVELNLTKNGTIIINHNSTISLSISRLGDYIEYFKISIDNPIYLLNLSVSLTVNSLSIFYIHNLMLASFLYPNFCIYDDNRKKWFIDLMFLLPDNILICCIPYTNLQLVFHNKSCKSIEIEYNTRYQWIDPTIYKEVINKKHEHNILYDIFYNFYCNLSLNESFKLDFFGRYLYFYTKNYLDTIESIQIKTKDITICNDEKTGTLIKLKSPIYEFIKSVQQNKINVITRIMSRKVTRDVILYNIVPYIFRYKTLNFYIVDIGKIINLKNDISVSIELKNKNCNKNNNSIICGSLAQNILKIENGHCYNFFTR